MQLNLNAYRLKVDCYRYRWKYRTLLVSQKIQSYTNNEEKEIQLKHKRKPINQKQRDQKKTKEQKNNKNNHKTMR